MKFFFTTSFATTLLIISLIALFISNCFTTEIIDENKPQQIKKSGGEDWYKSYLLGFIDSEEKMGTIANCPTGVSRVVLKKSASNTFAELGLQCISYIVSPIALTFRTNEIYCVTPQKTTKVKSKKEEEMIQKGFTDTVILKNGTTFKNVKSIKTEDSVIVQSQIGQTLTFKLAEVFDIQSSE
ncbi:MAG: hypothetical protein H7A23_19405 [Leptospiraceae bacterium]|nr:hypothetical protein [Leptospiraceae bacterium]MCP5496723.1 hypothetical protein [Leptospiraceae bacterium]